MTDERAALFTAAEVENLAKWQTCGMVHPFTCGNDGHPQEYAKELIPTARGWICPGCDYTQIWAHDFMLDGTGLPTWNARPTTLERAALADELERLAKDATPGPIRFDHDWHRRPVIHGSNGIEIAQMNKTGMDQDARTMAQEADPLLFVALRNNLPAIIAALRKDKP